MTPVSSIRYATRANVFPLILTARIVRAIAYGLFSVAFALFLSQRGLTAVWIGLVLTLALLAGAAFSFATGYLVRRFGRSATLIAAAALMTLAAAILGLGGGIALTIIAVSLGTFSAGGQEVGPFGPIEQHLVAESSSQRLATRTFAIYNLAGSVAAACGALLAGFVALTLAPWLYAASGAALVVLYALLATRPELAAQPRGDAEAGTTPHPVRSSGVAEKLTILFGIDALAGGFVVQSFLAYWLHVRFGVDQNILGPLFFATNLLSGVSFLVAAKVANRIGLLRTMVFTHLPSNVLLALVPFMPSMAWAAVVLLARFALSQMDVPTRQAFTMYAVRPEERARAAGLTNAVRPAAAALAPVLSGLALQTAAVGLPFFLAGGLKIVYDLAMLALFSRTPLTAAEGEE
jgi:MFS family permease